ncbi:MAG: hypothetical protein IPM57_08375 [Oligoflexia bacterium]|nr:hypothetical protein [Oligoflexia bacterium]
MDFLSKACFINIYEILMIISFIFFTLITKALDCQKWFNDTKLQVHRINSLCYENCRLRNLRPDANSDDTICTVFCKDLCKERYKPVETYSKSKSIAGSFIFYPGLNETEKKLIKKNPNEALIVYKQKNTAEEITEEYFPNSTMDSEGDAFRHFVWAGLLVKELGRDKAQIYLDAHEENPRQTQVQKAMDLANNRAGIIEALRLKEKDSLTLETIKEAAFDHIKDKKLIILNPTGKVPKEVK